MGQDVDLAGHGVHAVGQGGSQKVLDGFFGIGGIEVARYHDGRFPADFTQAVGFLTDHTAHEVAVSLGLTAIAPAGQMAYHHVEGVSPGQFASHVEQVARRQHTGMKRGDTEGIDRDGTETVGLEQQGDVDAAHIGGTGDDVFISEEREGGAAGEVAQHAVVFHLSQSHQIGWRGSSRTGYDTRQTTQLAPITRGVPMMAALGREIAVLTARGVEGVEQVLDVVLHEAEIPTLGVQQGQTGKAQQQEQGAAQRTIHGDRARHAGWSWLDRAVLQTTGGSSDEKRS